MTKRNAQQNRYLHGILLRDFLIGIGAEVNPLNLNIMKEALKEYFSVAHTSSLSEQTFGKLTSAVAMIAAREFGVEIPESEANKSIEDLLKNLEHE